MSKINELNINISKAIITDIELKLDEEKGLVVSVSGSLLTKENRPVSTFRYSSEAWSDENKIEVPFDLNNPARTIFERMTPVIYEKLGNAFKPLPAPKNKKA